MFFKKKITFTCEIPGVEKTMPIIPIKQQTFEWRKAAAEEYNKRRSSLLDNKSIARCPGISGILTTGWVIRAWQDVGIETNGDGSSFKWSTPFDQKTICNFNYVGGHEEEGLTSMSNNWPSSTLRSIVKINTGWWTDVPKNHILLQLPVPYSDSIMFSAVPGVYSNELRVAEINIPLKWHALNSTEIIKAGTPLAQLILVPIHNYEMAVSGCRETTLFELYRQLLSSGFTVDYKRIKNIMKRIL